MSSITHSVKNSHKEAREFKLEMEALGYSATISKTGAGFKVSFRKTDKPLNEVNADFEMSDDLKDETSEDGAANAANKPKKK